MSSHLRALPMAGGVPAPSSQVSHPDPYAEIDPLTSSAEARAALFGILIGLALAAAAAILAPLFVSAVFHPGSVA